jgi:glutathione S-transferase
MDWQLSVMGPALTPVFWNLVRTPPEQRDMKAVDAGKVKSTEAVKMLDDRLNKTAFLAGEDFSYGDIPVGVMARRYRDLVSERPAFANFERWFAALSARAPFQQHVLAIPLV